MKLSTIFAFLIALSIATFTNLFGQSSQIKGIQEYGAAGGIAFTRDAIYQTEDKGESWIAVPLPKTSDETICSVFTADKEPFWVLLYGNRGLRLLRTADFANDWKEFVVEVSDSDREDAALENVVINYVTGTFVRITLPLVSSSNFDRHVDYVTEDGGNSWQRINEAYEKKTEKKLETLKAFFEEFHVSLPEIISVAEDIPEETIITHEYNPISNRDYQRHSDWYLTQSGNCTGFKSGCYQVTKVYAGVETVTYEGERHYYLSVREITPPQIRELARAEREAAARTATPQFALPPGGTTRISLNRGFDMCNAPTTAQMQAWWNNSPLYDMNIYMSGRNRACSAQPNLSAGWVNQVTAMGWGLIPTVVGYQSPCTASTTTAKLSFDPATAETQGRGEADIAVAAANNLGLTAGSILYYDMERYDETGATAGCRTATTAFLKGWTDRIHELGYKSGVYGSPKNAQEDWMNMPAANKPDAVWLANWDNNAFVWSFNSFPSFPQTVWNNHQRIKQWQAPHNETWGGVTFNIDGNISDAPVAGVAIAKNKVADFDGDGKSDLSVFRPDSGIWFVTNSSNSGFQATQFGVSTDRIVPADYDGDGKTDYAVFRSDSGIWFTQVKANTFGARQWGQQGDIPLPGDYNGDGKADLAVYRPSTTIWYILGSDSRNTPTYVQFGAPDDVPVPADYDGDGKTDIAVWRPSSGIWFVSRSSDGVTTAEQWGVSTDKLVPGDYDGDGKCDYAVYRDGVWFLKQSTDGYYAVQFGIPSDLPIPGDYDGDGRMDISVFRSSNGIWYEQRSQAGFAAFQFGQDNDRPVPRGYLPQ